MKQYIENKLEKIVKSFITDVETIGWTHERYNSETDEYTYDENYVEYFVSFVNENLKINSKDIKRIKQFKKWLNKYNKRKNVNYVITYDVEVD